MKARVKATGEIVEVYERYDDLAMETVYEELARSYSRDELDFSVPETRKEAKENAKTFASETAVLEGWVARDMDGGLFLYPFKPYRKSAWFAIPKDEEYNAAMQIDKSLFPSVTWQSEPKKVRIELTLIDE